MNSNDYRNLFNYNQMMAYYKADSLLMPFQQQQPPTNSLNSIYEHLFQRNLALTQQQLSSTTSSTSSQSEQQHLTNPSALQSEYEARFNSLLTRSNELNYPLYAPPPPGLSPYRRSNYMIDNAFVSNMLNEQRVQQQRVVKPEEPKPSYSYIGLIAMAILSSPEKKLVLSDIYQWILDNYVYFRARGPGWRNSIRHNLSLNDCFIKSGRSANGKGHYWAIHPANLEDFSKGDFRRRRAQRRVRKSLGLTVPEEEEDDDEEILTSPSTLSPIQKNYENHNDESLCRKRAYELHGSPNSLQNKRKRFDNNDSTVDINGSIDENLSISGKSNSEHSTYNTTLDDGDELNNLNNTSQTNKSIGNDKESNESSSASQSVNENIEASPASEQIASSESKTSKSSKKRGFDVDDLLAPDNSNKHKENDCKESTNESDALASESANKEMANGFMGHHQAGLFNPLSNVQLSATNCNAMMNAAQLYRNYAMLQNNPLLFYQISNAINNSNNLKKEKEDTTESQSIKESKPPNNRVNCTNPNQNRKIETSNIDVEKWKETFSKIMARSYKNHHSSNVNASSNTKSHNSATEQDKSSKPNESSKPKD